MVETADSYRNWKNNQWCNVDSWYIGSRECTKIGKYISVTESLVHNLDRSYSKTKNDIPMSFVFHISVTL